MSRPGGSVTIERRGFSVGNWTDWTRRLQLLISIRYQHDSNFAVSTPVVEGVSPTASQQ
jgi:hypothetical protein